MKDETVYTDLIQLTLSGNKKRIANCMIKRFKKYIKQHIFD